MSLTTNVLILYCKVLNRLPKSSKKRIRLAKYVKRIINATKNQKLKIDLANILTYFYFKHESDFVIQVVGFRKKTWLLRKVMVKPSDIKKAAVLFRQRMCIMCISYMNCIFGCL